MKAATIRAAVLTVLSLGLTPVMGMTPGRVYRVAIDREYEPYEFTDDRGDAQGFAPALLRAIGEEAGVRFVFVPLTWPAAVEALRAGKADLVDMIPMPERALRYEFSAPHSRITQAIFRHHGAGDVTGLSTLAGHTVGFQQDDISLQELMGRTDFKRRVFKSKLDGMLHLNLGEIDAFLCAETVGVRLVSHYKLSNIDMAAGGLFPQDFAFAARKGDRVLIALLDRSLARLRASGRHEALSREWLTGRLDPPSWVEKNRFLLFALGSLLLAALLLALSWNRVLRQRVLEATSALREGEARNQVFLDVTRDGVHVLDTRGNVVEANMAFCRMLGYTRDEMRRLNVADWDVRWSREELLAKIAELIARPALFETRHRRKDGTFLDVEINAAGVALEGRDYLHVSARDITDRKRAEEALRASEARFRAIIDASPLPMALNDEQQRITFLNPAFVQTFGYTQEDIPTLAQWWPKAYPDPEYRQQTADSWQAELARAKRTATAFSPMELTVRCKNGKDKTVLIRAASISGLFGGDHLVVFSDITERKKNAAALANVQKLESLGTLAGGIAHDFNNILTSILGNVSLLESRIKADGEALTLIREAQAACETAKGLARQMLTFAKGGSPVVKVMDLRLVLTQAAGFAARGSNARCVFDLGDAPLAVNIDPGQVAQVIQNMVLNAIQAMAGEISIRASVVDLVADELAPLKAGRYVRVSVSDQGVGIPPQVLSKIFEPYFSTKSVGRGLGLAVCYSIMAKHGGLIAVDPCPGAGAVFTLHFPVANASDLVRESECPVPRAGAGRVLIMDDEASVAAVLKRILVSLGYAADCVADGQAALEAYRREREAAQPYAAVIMDLTIAGGMGGKEAIVRLKALDPQAKVLVSSGYADDPVMAGYSAHGFLGMLAKPYRITEVAEALRRVIASA